VGNIPFRRSLLAAKVRPAKLDCAGTADPPVSFSLSYLLVLPVAEAINAEYLLLTGL
jgi:hypothetical protein